MRAFIENIAKLIMSKIFVYGGLFLFLALFYKMTMQRGYFLGAIIALLPIISITSYLLFKRPFWIFIFLFILAYLIMGINRYISIKVSIIIDSIMIVCIVTLLFKTAYEKFEWKRSLNPLTLLTALWLLFCVFELLNPRATTVNWATAVRGMAVYPLIMVILVSVLCCKYKHLKLFLFLWSILTLMAALKGYSQKNHGFDPTEVAWLLLGGGARTHLISSGIRYFSFFTDAGNFGSNMGMSMVVFSITALYIKGKWIKIYYLVVSILACYGMVISGTRGALAVPFAGYLLFTVLSKNWKIALSSIFVLISAFIFLNFTTLGNDHQEIKRMRTAFDKNDASLNVRLENQKKLNNHMANLPYGMSIGFNTDDKNDSYYEMSKIPNDSWYVLIWMQTGIVGLTIHIILLTSAILIGGFIILFQIRNKELSGLLAAILASLFGMLISNYGNALLGQFPNSLVFFIFQAFIFIGKYYDKELENHE